MDTLESGYCSLTYVACFSEARQHTAEQKKENGGKNIKPGLGFRGKPGVKDVHIDVASGPHDVAAGQYCIGAEKHLGQLVGPDGGGIEKIP